MADEIGVELMQLYSLMRVTTDPKQKDAIKARIDATIEEARGHFSPEIIGTPHQHR
jgi:hypothetical protein